KLIEFFLGSILIAISTIALIFFSMLHYILRVGGVADCAWHGSAKAWIDSNRDGLVNDDESLLGNVVVHIDDVKNRLVDVGWPAITDPYGDAQLHVSIPSCSNSVFDIYADIPEGFRVTTRPRIEIDRDFWGNLGTENIYYFGFISDK
ncbi:MAG TPA: hypothetical protein VKB04_13205, partial [Anaerolineales bacterium]|nr:hypothetical protein [Anaerolineales bacterium]